jgi:hypothetical protein
MQKLLFFIRLLLCRYGVNPLFLVKINNGTVTKICGQVKPSFLSACAEIAQRNQVTHGFVFATNGPYNRPIVKASSNIPKDVLQQFRNAYSF